MFKMFPPTFFVVPVAWLTVLLLTGLNAATPILEQFGISPQRSWVVFCTQAILTAFFVTPAWRILWWMIPAFNRWVYPNLDGEWDVDVLSNWPRIDATLKAANGETAPIDMRNAGESALPPLGAFKMRARITQSWATMKVVLWNPTGQGPIKESQTLAVQPFRGEEGRHGLVYVFEQENNQTVVSDDRKFFGAARLVVDLHNPKVLSGYMWTDRMWRRGMNTAAEIHLTRRSKLLPMRR
jgi:hypothetical protein